MDDGAVTARAADQIGAKWDRYNAALHGDDDADRRTVERAEWKRHPVVRAHLERRSDGPLESWLAHQLPAHCRTVLSVGGGIALREIDLLAQGHMEQLVVMDVSAHSMDIGRRHAAESGVGERVEFVAGTFSEETIRERAGALDAVVFLSSLHHLADAHDVLAAVRRCLSPRGVVIGDEYVGPDRFAFDDRVRALADAYYRRLPTHLRGPWPELPSPDPAAVAADDPSEAIDSASIVDAIRDQFPMHRIDTLGGALAFPVWFGLDHDALFDTAVGHAAVEALVHTDLRLTLGGVIPSYFCRFVGHAAASSR